MGFRIQRRTRSTAEGGKPASLTGKLGLTVFLSLFIVMGGFFATMGYQRVQRGIDQRGWAQHPGVVESSHVAIDPSDNEPYTPRVRYRYDVAGKAYTGQAIRLDEPSTNRYREAQAVTLDHPAGAPTTVWVNPDDPADAVLERDGIESLGFALFMALFLLLFMGVPLAILIRVWWPGGGKRADTPKRKKRTKQASPANLIVFGGVFAAAGGIALYFMAIRPISRTLDAKGWAAVPCVVERSAVLTFDGDDGDTYKADILYFYEVDGRRYGSNRYSFGSFGSSSGRSGKQRLVEQHPVGHETTCYVDPDDPTQAVLVRGLTKSNWWGLFPLPFLAVGLGLMIAGARQSTRDPSNRWRPGSQRPATDQDPTDGDLADDAGPVTLRPRGARIGKFFGFTAIGVFWNGIVSVFATQVVKSYLQGDPDVCLTIFLIPFLIVGVVFITLAFKQLLLIFAPSVVLELGRRAIPIGGATDLRWHIAGRPGRVDRVTITLIGEESATYTRGTDTITDTETFYEQVLVGNADEASHGFDTLPMMHDRGELVLAIPADTMHSFAASRNKIVWKLRVFAEVARWPDPKDDYTITVLPLAVDHR